MKKYEKNLIDKSLNKTDLIMRKKLIKEAKIINKVLEEIEGEDNRELFILKRLITIIIKNNI